jgi:hypothetical protein
MAENCWVPCTLTLVGPGLIVTPDAVWFTVTFTLLFAVLPAPSDISTLML